MRGWLRRIRGALGMGLTWAVAWGLVGLAIEVVHNVWPNPLGSMVDIWPAALGLPAFLGGLLFAGVLGIAGRHHRFDELSLMRLAAWGAAGGFLVSLIPAVLVAAGLVTLDPGLSAGKLTAALSIPLALMGAASASGSLLLARVAEDGRLVEAGAGADLPTAGGAGAEELPGGGRR